MTMPHRDDRATGCRRRDFLRATGVAAGALALGCRPPMPLPTVAKTGRAKRPARVRGAFLYPPSEALRKPGGWWSWPGKDFDAEGRQRQYTAELGAIAARLGVDLAIENKPLDGSASVAAFLSRVEQAKPDGVLLIPLKHGHFAQVNTVIKAVECPLVIYSCLGVKHGSVKGYERAGVHFSQSLDDLSGVADALRMIHTMTVMRQSRILSVGGRTEREYTVPHVGTQVRAVPVARFAAEVDRTETTAEARALARAYMRHAKRVVEPREPEVVTAARVHFACQAMLEAEQCDAIMMDCLRRGLYMPCMSFMTLRDSGIAAGCENDLSATLTLMLVQLLFDRPGFQANPGYDTVRNQYFHSHCTCPTRLLGPDGPAAPYLLRDYAHTNDPTCCPQVLWTPGQPVTLAHYEPGTKPTMLLYSGEVVQSYAMPPVGGCRTNVVMTVNEVRNAIDVKGHHDVLFCGSRARQLREFARLYGIAVAV